MNDELIANAFTLACNALDALPGHYCIVEWTSDNPNKLWISGPYDEAGRAERDAKFFRDSPNHPKINRWYITKGGKA